MIGNGNQFSFAYSATNLTLNVVTAYAPSALSWSIVSPATEPAGDPGSALRIWTFAQTAVRRRIPVQTVAGASYRLEGTEDLTNWTTLLNDIPGTGNLLKFLDPETTALPGYFYRIILLP